MREKIYRYYTCFNTDKQLNKIIACLIVQYSLKFPHFVEKRSASQIHIDRMLAYMISTFYI